MRFSFFCPSTDEHFALDHDLDWREIDQMRERMVEVACPACHQQHSVLFSTCMERPGTFPSPDGRQESRLTSAR